MADSQKHIEYTATHIKRYLSGEMPAAEMHQLERQALDDPFLSDAIEGMRMAFEKHGTMPVMENIPGPAYTRAGTSNTPVVPIYKKFLYAAAVLVLIFAGAYLYYSADKDSSAPQLTRMEENSAFENSKAGTIANDSIESQVADSVSVPVGEIESNTEASDVAMQNDKPAAKSLPRKNSPVERPASEQASPADTLRLNMEEVAVSAPVQSRMIQSEAMNDIVVTATPGNASVNKMAVGPVMQYTGKVTNEDNKPLAFANVQLNNYQQHYLTDEEGRFNFYSRDTLLRAQVDLNGYQEKMVTLKNTTGANQIVLNRSIGAAEVSEAKAPSAGMPEQRKTQFASLPAGAVPEHGWISFERYLEKSKRIKNSTIHGEVEVFFEVSPSGKPMNIQVIKSLSPSFDQEAIRLIKDGPLWNTPLKRKSTAKVTIAF